MHCVRRLLCAVVVAIFTIVWQILPVCLSVPFDVRDDQGRTVAEGVNTSPDKPRVAHLDSMHNQTHRATASNHKRAPLRSYEIKIVAIGDIHGDLQSFQDVLQMAGVTHIDNTWSGYVNYLVQTGDIIDRGDDTIELFKYMDTLRRQAREQGGVVVSLLGNHEYWNVIPAWPEDCVSEREIATFGGENARWRELTTGKIGTSWRDHYQVASRLPLHPSVGDLNADYTGDKSSDLSHSAISFVHGGLPPDFPYLTPFPSHINDLGRSVLKKMQTGRDPDVQTLLADGSKSLSMLTLTDEEQSVIAIHGPLWYRGWAEGEEKDVCARVAEVLEKTGTRRMVMGHTAQLDYKGILSRCGGQVIVIDTGISRVYHYDGGMPSALFIEYSLVPDPELAENPEQQGWTETERVFIVGDDDDDDDDVFKDAYENESGDEDDEEEDDDDDFVIVPNEIDFMEKHITGNFVV